MSPRSTRSALFLAACASALSAPLLLPLSANAQIRTQVSAANTIAPQNTVVAQPLPTAKPSAVADVPSTPQVAGAAPSTMTTAKPAKAAKAATTSKKPGAAAKAKTSVSSTLVAPGGDAVVDPASVTDSVDTQALADAPVVAVAEAVSFSDPLADLAVATLDVIANGGGGTISGAGTVSVSGQTSPPTSIVAAAPAVQFAVAPPPTVAVDPNVPRPPSNLGSSSIIINTADLGDYVIGVAIAAPVSRESQAVLLALPTAGSDRYAALLKAMAKVVGQRTKTDPAALEAVWSRTEPRRMKAILTAMAQVGTRYHYTGNKPGGFDCSGLTSYAWSQAGVKIPRTSTLQYQGLLRKAAADLLPGDIVWHPGHVSMYLGVDQAIVDAPQTGKTVEVKKASSRSWISFLSPL